MIKAKKSEFEVIAYAPRRSIFRLTVTAKQGKPANTNAYYFKDLFE